MTEIASLVLFAANARKTADFYWAIGFDLEEESHEEGPVHLAVELGPVHYAIYEAAAPGRAPERRASSGTFPGFYVGSLAEVTNALRQSRRPADPEARGHAMGLPHLRPGPGWPGEWK